MKLMKTLILISCLVGFSQSDTSLLNKEIDGYVKEFYGPKMQTQIALNDFLIKWTSGHWWWWKKNVSLRCTGGNLDYTNANITRVSNAISDNPNKKRPRITVTLAQGIPDSMFLFADCILEEEGSAQPLAQGPLGGNLTVNAINFTYTYYSVPIYDCDVKTLSLTVAEKKADIIVWSKLIDGLDSDVLKDINAQVRFTIVSSLNKAWTSLIGVGPKTVYEYC